MVITINGSPITLDLDTILIWCLVGLVAGFLASRVALGHGLGLFGDVIVGILGAFLGGWLAGLAGIPVATGTFSVSGLIAAFVGAVILLVVFRALTHRGMIHT